MLTVSSLHRIRCNINLHYRKIPYGVSVGRQSLDENDFSPEDSLTNHDFLQCYSNWLTILDIIATPEMTAGWRIHRALMTEDSDWPHSFLAWRLHDQYLRTQFMAESFILNPDSEDYRHLFEKARNLTSLSNMRAEINDLKQTVQSFRAFPPPCPRHFGENMSPNVPSSSSVVRYHPYSKDWPHSSHSFREQHKATLCLRCGILGNRAASCFASQYNRPERPFSVEWKTDKLVDCGGRTVCLLFNVRGSCSDANPSHGIHACSLCDDHGHSAVACTRN
jgi:hypothetical protein